MRPSIVALLLGISTGCGARSDIDVGYEGTPIDAAVARDAPPIDAPPIDARPFDAPAIGVDAPTGPCSPRRLRIRFTPTARVQLAAAIDDGRTRFATLALTEAVALRGIGNRPGASQMNSGFRWPYGRREGVLPFWAHRRSARGGAFFRRVIFQYGRPEGHASETAGVPGGSRDDYFCLSFDASLSRQDGLDAVSCASTFHSDKGRFVTGSDIAVGIAEPFETAPGVGTMRPFRTTSLYPPRRDVVPTEHDHRDVARFSSEALRVMPELDAVTLATPRGDAPTEIVAEIPDGWPDIPYSVFVEVNTEGDHGGGYDTSAYPTPTAPAGAWDSWSQAYGYPYRGQPSVVFRVDVDIAPGRASTYVAERPIGYTRIDGSTGELAPLDDTIVDDPIGRPGSGADRLRARPDGTRLEVVTECL